MPFGNGTFFDADVTANWKRDGQATQTLPGVNDDLDFRTGTGECSFPAGMATTFKSVQDSGNVLKFSKLEFTNGGNLQGTRFEIEDSGARTYTSSSPAAHLRAIGLKSRMLPLRRAWACGG